VAIRTPPWNIVLSEVDDAAAIGALVDDLATDHGPGDLPGVLGPAEHAHVFAERWAARSGVRAAFDMSERIFRLTTVLPPRRAPGARRAATSSDRDLLIGWLDAFHDEAFGRPAPTDSASMVDRWLAGRSRTMWLWEEGGRAVSLCGIGMGTPNGFRIGPVYTPPEARRHGYASNLVAEVTQGGLDGGKRFGFLLADLANPTSNHIYQAIGYAPVRDLAVYLFERDR
jgi:predicted GNAT family acetyltransferase